MHERRCRALGWVAARAVLRCALRCCAALCRACRASQRCARRCAEGRKGTAAPPGWRLDQELWLPALLVGHAGDDGLVDGVLPLHGLQYRGGGTGAVQRGWCCWRRWTRRWRPTWSTAPGLPPHGLRYSRRRGRRGGAAGASRSQQPAPYCPSPALVHAPLSDNLEETLNLACSCLSAILFMPGSILTTLDTDPMPLTTFHCRRKSLKSNLAAA